MSERAKSNVTFYIETWIIEELNRQFKNRSAFVNEVLKRVLRSNEGSLSREMLLLQEIKDKLAFLESEHAEIKERVAELDKVIQEKQLIKESEDEVMLISILKDHTFQLAGTNVDKWLLDLKLMESKTGTTPSQAIMTRLSRFALDHKISVEKAKELFFKAFPSLKDKISLD